MQQNNNRAVIGLIAIVIIGVVAGIIIFKPKDSASVSNGSSISQPSNSSSATTNDTGSSSNVSYKDGIYSATGSYVSPGGDESIKVTVTLKGGTITDSNVQPMPSSEESSGYQSDFASGYKSLVVGKKISSLQLSRVSGSSLTSNGFNNALDAIKSQAKV